MKNLINHLAIFCFGCLIWSCDSNKEIDKTEVVTVDTAEEKDTAYVMETGKTTEEKLEEFRFWLNNKAEKGDTAIERNWPKIKEQLQRRNAELERDFDSLSSKSKEEYRELQKRYDQWENRQERRQTQPLETKKLSLFQDMLLQEYKNKESINADNIREVYLTFMGAVRAKKRNWTLDDWDYVDYVYSELNQRRRQLEGQISTVDKLKIRTLQAEYLALEGAADTESVVRGVKK